MAIGKFSTQVASAATGIVETNGLRKYQEFFNLGSPAGSITISVNGGVLPTALENIQVWDNGTAIFPSTGTTIRDWKLVAPGTIEFIEPNSGVETPRLLDGQITISFWA